MSKQQTAVEWLYQRLQSEPFLTVEDFNKAKEMERKQIKDAWLDSAMPNSQNVIYAEQYYNETYGDERNTKSI